MHIKNVQTNIEKFETNIEKDFSWHIFLYPTVRDDPKISTMKPKMAHNTLESKKQQQKCEHNLNSGKKL